MRFKDKVVVITGANQGIGRACALRFADEGGYVHILARNAERNATVQAEIEKRGARSQSWQVDLADLDHATETLNKICQTDGVDVLINNAAIVEPGQPASVSVDALERSFRINTFAPLLLSQAVFPVMTKRGGGHIVNVSSAYAKLAVPQVSAYCASKAALDQLMKCAAASWAESGVVVNTVVPGFTETPLAASVREAPERYEATLSNIPRKRWGTPDEIASAILFMASNDASYINGGELAVDGGILTYPGFAA